MYSDAGSLLDTKTSSSSKDALHYTLAKLGHLDLTGRVDYDNTIMKASGGYCDVFDGYATISPQHSGSLSAMHVAVKRLRVSIQKDRDFERLLAKELYIWSKLSHPNILPLQGFVLEGDYPVVVSQWMACGTVREYLQKHPDCDVEHMILGVTNGVDYLHKRNVVHSDLKAENVLINDLGEPMICDFGISRMLSSTATFAGQTSGGFKGSMRWMAYELLDDGYHTKETDVWAFGMTVYEILTRTLPYAHLRNDMIVMRAILGGDLPSRPCEYDSWSPFVKAAWDTCEKCWISPPEQRIAMDQVVSTLSSESGASNAVQSNILPHGNSSDISHFLNSAVNNSVFQFKINPAADQSKQYTPGDSTLAVQPSTKVIGSAASAAATITVDFASVPFLSPVVSIVIGMLQLCDKARTYKHEIRELVVHCIVLLYALKDSSASCGPDILQRRADSSQELFRRIKEGIKGWIERPVFTQLVQRGSVAEDIRHFHQDINTFLKTFGITSTMEAYQWISEFETVDYLSDSNNNQQIQQETFAADRAHLLAVMERMQEFMGGFPVGDSRHRGLQTNLLTIQRTSGQLLPRINLEHGEVRRVGNSPVGGNAQFDIWEGEYLGQERCAIKILRGVEITPKIKERFLREVTIWRRVWELDKGEYMLPFWGACLTDVSSPYMVSPWMHFGDAIKYVNKYPSVNRNRIVRRIAEGLRLLHTYEPPIIHGDIKGTNILINEKGNPLLADFGLSKIMEDLTGMPFTQSRGVAESYRWFAPELCSAPGVLSPASDVFAYSMTVLELMTGQPPFSHIKRTPEVLIKMQQGERPRRPEGTELIERGLDDKLWGLLTRCWVEDPATRPSIHEVIAELPSDSH